MSMTKNNPLGILSANLLKIIAMLAMTVDHYAVLFHPYDLAWRIPGRIAFPIFAFFIAEGYRYTKNRIRYFLTLAAAGTVFQLVYYFFTGGGMRNIFITLALSLIPVALSDLAKRLLLSQKTPLAIRLLAPLPLLLSVVALYFFDQWYRPDYGFFGCLLPLFASLFHMPRDTECPPLLKRLDILPVHLFCLAIPMGMLILTFGGVQIYSLFALPLLCLYSGKRGKWKMKYFFYIYYPLHLVALEGLYLLLR